MHNKYMYSVYVIHIQNIHTERNDRYGKNYINGNTERRLC